MIGPRLPAALLEAVPELAHAEWSRLAGLSGGVWCATPNVGDRLVVRPATSLEVAATVAAASMVVAPSVRGAAGGWLVTEFVPASHLSVLELARPAVLTETAGLLRRWHTASIGASERPLGAARAVYLERARAASPDLVRSLEPLLAAADRRERQLTRDSAGQVTGHLDVGANLLQTADGLRLIDFEYVAATDPNRELGQLAWEGELDPGPTRWLSDAYWRAADSAVRQAHAAAVAAWTWVVGVTWTLWGAAEADTGGALPLWTRRNLERVRSHWAVDDTP